MSLLLWLLAVKKKKHQLLSLLQQLLKLSKKLLLQLPTQPLLPLTRLPPPLVLLLQLPTRPQLLLTLLRSKLFDKIKAT